MTGHPRPRRASAWPAVAIAIALAAPACTSHNVKVEPIEVKPIHMTMDINLRIQRDLDQFFDFQDEHKAAGGATNGASETPASTGEKR